MKHSIFDSVSLIALNIFGLTIFKLDLHDFLNIGAFFVILISNWSKFSTQLIKWAKSWKKRKTNASKDKTHN